jgi:hypothetical protein
MPDLNQSNPSIKLLKTKCYLVDWYADLDGFRVDTYNYSDLPELHLGQKQSQTNTQISMWAKSGCKATNGVLAKDSKIGAIKTTILTCRVLWTLRYSMLLAPFSVKMMDPGTKEW